MSTPPRVPKLHGVLPRFKNQKLDPGTIKKYLVSAKKFYTENNFVKAHSMYVSYFENIPDLRAVDDTTKKEFTDVVCEIAYVLEQQDHFEELLKCYLQAINFFPNNAVLLNELGAYLYRVGEVEIAKKYIEDSIRCHTKYLPAERNLLFIKWAELPRWHFRMLNDSQRNKAYYDAITKAKSNGHKYIYDIGSGCGLLSLFAASGKDTEVIAIEESKVLSDMNKQIMKANNVMNVTVLNQHSTSIETETVPFKGSLLILEVFDVALFGEFAIDTLVHGLQVLADENNLQVIPARATLYATGISSIDILNRYQFINVIKELGLQNICIRQRDIEPYEAEMLNELSVVYRTNTAAILQVEFSDLNQLVTLKNGYKKIISLECVKPGPIHAIAVWFDLHLDDDIRITTNPKEDNVKCWEQAVFHLDHIIFLDKKEILLLEFSIENNCISFEVINPKKNCRCFTVSKEIIRYLNDRELMQTLMKLVPFYANNAVSVLDLEVFPVFGLLMAKHGAKFYHAYMHEGDLELLNYLLRVNRIDTKKFACVDQKHLPEFASVLENVDILFYDPINSGGNLNKMPIRKNIIDKWGAKVLPESYRLEVQLVESDYLYYCNRVDDTNVFGFKIAEFMNEYMGDEHPFLEKLGPCKTLSHPHHRGLSDMKNGTYEVTISVKNPGQFNGIYFWFELQFHEGVTFKTLRSYFYNKSSYLLKNPIPVTAGEGIKLIFQKYDEFIKLNIP